MRLLIVIYFFCLGMLALLAEMILPAHFRILGAIGVGSVLVPLVVIYATLELGDERGPILAGLLGFILDLAHPDSRLGVSVLILCSLSALIMTQAHRPEAHTWLFRLTFVLVGTFVFQLLDCLFALIQAGTWSWPLEVWSKITFSCLLNLILAPFLFLFADLPFRLCGWVPDRELTERTYAR